jgi:beta-alanine--pyruvate transaminase
MSVSEIRLAETEGTDLALRNDLSNYWMPFTANRQFKADPRLFVSANGLHYRSQDGRQILDGCAGLWCSNAGHGDPRIVAAIQKQAAELDYAPSFQVAHPLAFETASRIAELTPDGLDSIFFCNSGSEAVDTALKVALAYHRAKGDGARSRLIGRERGYHGVGFGGISVGGIVSNRKMFGTMLAGVDHMRHTHDPERNAFTRGMPEYGAELADDLERLVALHDASTIAAVIVEPVACSTGVLVPPKGYLERLRAICDRHGILLIFDEVITAFGRVGGATSTDTFGVVPDLMTFAKAVTNGTVPMGGVAVRQSVHDAIVDSGGPGAVEFAHGYTYSAHPLACAAALATLDVYAADGLFERAALLSPHWESRLHALRGHPHIVDLRNIGLIAAIEFSPREGAPGARAYEFYRSCFERGLFVRATGDIIALSPPLTITAEQIDILFDTIEAALHDLA